MILYGASGHGKVVCDLIFSQNMCVTHFFDDNVKLLIFENIKVSRYSRKLFSEESLIISIGDNVIRKKISETISHQIGKVAHRQSIISSSANFDLGTVVMQGSIIQANAKIGKHVIINTGASVDHDCIIEDFVHISPHSTLCGNVFIGEGTNIGANSTIIPGVKVGKWSVIGAGSVVIRDVPDFCVIVGNPAKIIKYLNK